jgi:hypothetical protein
VCDQATATLYDHGLGHIVPRDQENVGKIADILGVLLPQVARGEEAALDKARMETMYDEKRGEGVEGIPA